MTFVKFAEAKLRVLFGSIRDGQISCRFESEIGGIPSFATQSNGTRFTAAYWRGNKLNTEASLVLGDLSINQLP